MTPGTRDILIRPIVRYWKRRGAMTVRAVGGDHAPTARHMRESVTMSRWTSRSNSVPRLPSLTNPLY